MHRILVRLRQYPKVLLAGGALALLTLVAVVAWAFRRRGLSNVDPGGTVLRQALEKARNAVGAANARAAVELAPAYKEEENVRKELAASLAIEDGSERRKKLAELARRVRQ